MLRIDYVMSSDEFEPLSYEVIDSWTLEQVARRQRGVRDTVWRRMYGYQQAIPSFEGVVESGEAYEGDSTRYWVDNKVLYSDHYPVFVRLLYNGKTN